MPNYPIDVHYACAQLGLDAGASLEDIHKVLAHAAAYRFSTKSRLTQVQRLVDFFEAREQFGTADHAFADIRKAYHKKAMHLHPDHTKADPMAEEQLKALNAGFELIEAVYLEAKDYFQKDEDVRRENEDNARMTREKEAPPEAKTESKAKTAEAMDDEAGSSYTRSSLKYMAASVPRFLRQTRLGYLPLTCIIGTKLIKGEKGQNLVFDIVMLPAQQFQRMRTYVGLQHIATPELRMGPSFQPSYVLADAKVITVPADLPDPVAFAREHFMVEFGLINPVRK